MTLRASITDFVFSSEDIVNPIHISKANMTFNPGMVTLNNFKAKTGDSDIEATGIINNLLGFLLSDNTLKGDFKVTSSLFKVSDFMTEDKTNSKDNKTTSDSEFLKIPALHNYRKFKNVELDILFKIVFPTFSRYFVAFKFFHSFVAFIFFNTW